MNRPTWWERVRRINPPVWDALLAAVLLAITAASVVAGGNVRDGAAWALSTLSCVPLAFRRRAPLVVVAIVSGATVAFAIAGDGASPEMALALAIYTVAAHRPWRQVATVGDAATGKRPRSVLAARLHASGTTAAGQSRRTGYRLVSEAAE